MKLTLTALALATALVLAACGGGDSDDDGSATAAPNASDTVSIDSIDGNDVLVDSDGAALYTSEQEKDGKVRCTGECAAIWLPLDAPAGQPMAGSDVPGEVGVVKRQDGARQVTLDGRPLYRFADDGGPGKVTGDGFSDDFAGQTFTWHVEGAGGTSTDTGSGEDGDGDGYGY